MCIRDRASKVTVDKDSTVIVEGAGNPEAIANRVAVIKSQIETTTSEFDREKLQERLAKLSGGVAVIKVGAATETELKEMKLRIEDALNATRAAVEAVSYTHLDVYKRQVVGRSYYLDRGVKRIHFRKTFKLLVKNAIIKGIKCERKCLM